MITNEHLLWISGAVAFAVVLLFPSEQESQALTADFPVELLEKKTQVVVNSFASEEDAMTFARSETLAVSMEGGEEQSKMQSRQLRIRENREFMVEDQKIEPIFRHATNFAAGVPHVAQLENCDDASCRRR